MITSEALLPALSQCPSLIMPLLEITEARRVIYIGSPDADMISKLLSYVESVDGKLSVIDFFSGDFPAKKAISSSAHVQLICDFPDSVLPILEAADVYIIDNDYNYYSVFKTLSTAWGLNAQAHKPFLAIVRGVGWPFAYRDAYRNPEIIPEENRKPYSWSEGLFVENEGLQPDGLRVDNMAFACHEGGEKNGVQKAIWDFSADKTDLKRINIPALCGLSVIFSKHAPYSDKLTTFLNNNQLKNDLIVQFEEHRLNLCIEFCIFQSEIFHSGRYVRRKLKTFLMPQLSSFQQPILSLAKVLSARRIVLIGGGNIDLSEKLLQYIESVEGKFICIEEHVSNLDLKKLLDTSPNGKWIFENSREAISSMDAADLYILDGDHNYYTVKGELGSIWKLHEKAGKPFMAIVRGIHWPFGKRDAYYVPETIPEEHRHPFTWTRGVMIENPGTILGGLRFDDMAFANVEGGGENGVFTAVADFLEDKKEQIKFTTIPGFCGLGFLYSANAPWTGDVSKLLDQYHNNPLLEAMEQNRLELLLQASKFESDLDRENIRRQNGSFDTEQFCKDIQEGKGKKNGLGLVSIIIPTLNREDLLERAISSALKQTYQDIEVVVINDGGKTVRPLIESFNDARILYIEHKERKGLPAARNTAIRQANGQYIAYLDDDDLYYSNHIEVVINAIHVSGCPVAYTDTFSVYCRKNNGDYAITHRTLRNSIAIDPQTILVSSEFPPLSLCHAKTCLDQVGFFDETLSRYEDWDLWIRLSQEYPFLHIPIPTNEYVITEGYQQMITSWTGMFLDALLVIHHRYRHLVEGKPTLQAEQSAFRTKSRYRSYRQLDKIDADQFYELKLDQIMKNIIKHSFLYTNEDVRGAYALLAYMVERFPEIVELPALFAQFDTSRTLPLD